MKRPKLSLARQNSRDNFRRVILLALAGFGSAMLSNAGTGDLGKVGAEVAVGAKLPGEQTGARVVLSRTGGLVVFQSNGVDSDGFGIGAVRLNTKGEASGGAFVVNTQFAGDQETPDAAIGSQGSVLVVWRHNLGGKGAIFGRLIDASGAFKSPEIQLSADGAPDTLNPVVTGLSDGNFCVAWAQRETEGVMQDVWFQRVSSSGVRLGTPSLANQYTWLNQRTPAVSSLRGGGFVVAWVSEEQTGDNSVDLFARTFASDGLPNADEIQVNTGFNACANPVMATDGAGNVAIAWADLLADGSRRSWDVNYRLLDGSGQLAGTPKILNTHQNGRQYRPKIAPNVSGFIVAWTSFGQDGWDEGVFARSIDSDGVAQGDELQVNTLWKGRQFEPDIAANAEGKALVVWSSYSSASGSVGLVSQTIAFGSTSLSALPLPYVTALTATRIGIAWPKPAGLDVSSYEVVFDNAAPVSTANNFWTSHPLTPASTHSVRLGYVLADGRRGPLTEIVEATTWGEDSNGDGLPDDWQTLYWSGDSSLWPSPVADTDQDGTDNRSEFLAGTNPINPSSNLRLLVATDSSATTLRWTTVPGSVYQILASTDFKSWQPLGEARFASGESDLLQLSSKSQMSFYRVTRVR